MLNVISWNFTCGSKRDEVIDGDSMARWLRRIGEIKVG